MAAITARWLSAVKTAFPVLSLTFAFLNPALLRAESLTMTTYYPAPFGGYAKLLTTSDTFLARDGGSVGIGTTSPAANAKLDVNGNIYGSNVFANGDKVLTRISCPDGKLACTISGNTLTITLAPLTCTGCTPSAAAVCGQSTSGKDSCGNYCEIAAVPCVCSGCTPSAAAVCGVSTPGKDSCGNSCTISAVACVCSGCTPITTPVCGKSTSGLDTCKNPCTIPAVRCANSCADLLENCLGKWPSCLTCRITGGGICTDGDCSACYTKYSGGPHPGVCY